MEETIRGHRRFAAFFVRIAVGVLIVLGFIALFRGCREEPRMLSGKARKAAYRQFGREGVELTIREPIGVSRTAEPVTSGVPLPEGRIRDAAELVLLHKGKNPVPCQFTPKSRWPDGSIKWVLLDFQADVAASNTANYFLSMDGKPVKTSNPVTVTTNQSCLTLETGNLKLGIMTNLPGLLHSVVVNGVELISPTNPVQTVLVDAGNRVFRASKPTEVKIEHQGPMRSTVLIRGQYTTEDGGRIFDGKVGYDLRVTAYAGKPYVKLDFTLKNDGYYGYRNENHPRQWLYMKSLRLDFAVPGAETDRVDMAFGGKLLTATKGQRVEMTQWYKYPFGHSRGLYDVKDSNPPHERASSIEHKLGGFHYTWSVNDVGSASNGMEGEEGRIPGIAVWNAGRGTEVTLAVRRFWQNFPMGFAGSVPGGVSFVMFPAGECWPRTREAYDACTFQFEGGRRKTATLLARFGPQGLGTGEMVTMLDSPLFARAAMEWYRNTGAVLPLANAEQKGMDKDLAEAMERYDRLQRSKVRAECGDPAGVHEFWQEDRWGKVSIPSLWERCPDAFCGWMNYGDLIWAHGYCSLFYEWPYSMLQHYLRLGDREFLDVADDMVRHRYDIDQYHVENTMPYLGGFQRYEKGEHGHLERQVNNPRWEKNSNPSHTWNRCLLLHWALTGDPRSLDAALQNGRAFRRFFYDQHKLGEKAKLPWGEFRVPAWAMENWLALYEYTGERQYLDWANEVFDKTLLAMERDNGSRGHILKDGRQSVQFVSYLVEPVCRLHHYTGRRDVIDWLARVLDWQYKAGTIRGEKKDGVYYPLMWREDWDEDPPLEEEISLGVTHHYNALLADGYAYLYHVLGGRGRLKIARRIFRDAMFYMMTDRVSDPAYRSPLGYHHLATVFGGTPKVRALDGRYGQLYLYVEEQE